MLLSLIALLWFLFAAVIAILILGSFVLWIWMLIDCAVKEPNAGNDKVIWILVIIFAHGLGALIYLLIRRPERIRLYGK